MRGNFLLAQVSKQLEEEDEEEKEGEEERYFYILNKHLLLLSKFDFIKLPHLGAILIFTEEIRMRKIYKNNM